MKCQILFSRNSKKNIISFSSAESAHSMVSVKSASKEKEDKHFHIRAVFTQA